MLLSALNALVVFPTFSRTEASSAHRLFAVIADTGECHLRMLAVSQGNLNHLLLAFCSFIYWVWKFHSHLQISGVKKPALGGLMLIVIFYWSRLKPVYFCYNVLAIPSQFIRYDIQRLSAGANFSFFNFLNGECFSNHSGQVYNFEILAR
ncbi:hypothetical protein 7AX3_59 [uncultured Caudovirales phage]|uniref:Uncharacterized protein n=1 Tax=uncultured Caudovirales phage TaxID=2100421 RepID=A0A2H4J2X3_9CAUD|nr:hypothetical protein 7AX3_59 [uncultured Caudovirales phage]